MRYLSLSIFILALICAQLLIGGARQVFGLPAYLLLAVSGLTLVAVRRDPVALRVSCLIFAGALAGFVVGRAILSPVDYVARYDLFMVVAALVAYLATAAFYTDQKSRLILVGALLVTALAQALVGFIQFKENNDFMPLPGIMRPSYGWRASGFYICPNHLAGLLEMTSLLGLSIVCWGKCRVWVRVIIGYGVLMSLAALALTGSRGGYLSIVFGFGVFAVLSLWIVRRLGSTRFWNIFAALLFGGALVVGGALFVMLRSDTLATRLTQIYDPTNMRPLMWQAALDQHRIEPLIGTGSGTYVYYGRQFRSPLVQNDPIHVHNDYLELLAEYGIIGVVLCAAFVLWHLFGGVGRIQRIVDETLRPVRESSSNDLALVVGALSGIGALLLHSTLDFNLHIPANTLLIAVLFAFLASPLGASTETFAVSAPWRSSWLRWMTAAVSVALLLIAARHLPGEVCAERARVALRDDRNAEAIPLAERGLAWDPKNPNLFAHVGEAKHFLTQHVTDPAAQRALHLESAEAYRKALLLAPQDTGLLLNLGQTLDLLGSFNEAEDVYARAFECDPYGGNVYAYYGRHLQMRRLYKSAERYYRRALSLAQWPVAVEGMASIERMKQDPVSRTMMSLSPEPDDDTLAPPHVLHL